MSMDSVAIAAPKQEHFDFGRYEKQHEDYILEKLAESKERAKDPRTKWYTHNEVVAMIKEKRSQRNV
ncbi:MAG: hypothetical protein FWG87_05255 [Defluviitaleaceae bacterium]|nr:hypothetical protein [Defluviitaleaceae bacterium]